ncbi:MAG TPA: hypothetical protein VNH45_07355 [Gaiellaceae bacterium]|nr:hypothetical protein [Gaiellaceae bacterium]
MNILVINKSSAVTDAQIQNWLPAFNVYVGHVCEWWPRAVSLVWCPRDKEPELAWKLVFADKSDEAGDLGYHDFTPDGRPISYVFAADVKADGSSVPVTATHEIAEMIADPWISENFQISNTRFFAKEICDPCESDEFAYSIKVQPFAAVKVSDFVLPKWFIPKSTGQFDRNKKIDAPLKILPGGYMSVFTASGGWKQIGARKGGRVAELGQDPKKKGQFGRLTKYGRDRP